MEQKEAKDLSLCQERLRNVYGEYLLKPWEREFFRVNLDQKALALTRWLEKRHPDLYEKLSSQYAIVNDNDFHSTQSLAMKILGRSYPQSVAQMYSDGFFTRFYILRNRDNPLRIRKISSSVHKVSTA